MTPEERFERIEQTLSTMTDRQREHEEWQREMDKRHEGFRQKHEFWLLDMQSAVRELHASQQVTEERLQRLIRALSGVREGNGHA